MRKDLCVLLLAAVLVSAGPVAAPAQAQARPDSTSLSAAEKKHSAVKRHRADDRQIACTKFGCRPIPRDCHPETQLDWRGNPTGYDAIVCR